MELFKKSFATYNSLKNKEKSHFVPKMFLKNFKHNIWHTKEKNTPRYMVYKLYGGDDRIRTDDPLLARQML